MSYLIYKPVFKYKCQGCGHETETEISSDRDRGLTFGGPDLPPCPNGCYYVPSDWTRESKDKPCVFPVPSRIERPAQNIKDFVEQQKKIPW